MSNERWDTVHRRDHQLRGHQRGARAAVSDSDSSSAGGVGYTRRRRRCRVEPPSRAPSVAVSRVRSGPDLPRLIVPCGNHRARSSPGDVSADGVSRAARRSHGQCNLEEIGGCQANRSCTSIIGARGTAAAVRARPRRKAVEERGTRVELQDERDLDRRDRSSPVRRHRRQRDLDAGATATASSPVTTASATERGRGRCRSRARATSGSPAPCGSRIKDIGFAWSWMERVIPRNRRSRTSTRSRSASRSERRSEMLMAVGYLRSPVETDRADHGFTRMIVRLGRSDPASSSERRHDGTVGECRAPHAILIRSTDPARSAALRIERHASRRASRHRPRR